ncbi:phosphatase PAP2 family protein [Grimontia hollisae]|uniref:phosphatase PAP2 family protein n=1 Tax=Grimontia hollisae TaxID=673 RepID=UPI0018EF2AAB|nr:phosphatase PAP2 family protein [Grimontia hollisae]
MTTMKKILLVFILSIIGFSPAYAAEEETSIKGAACLVSDIEGRILVTRDILNNRISIPGGYIDNDNPADAAVRETKEETGIDVEVVKEIARPGQAVLFDCRALSPIPIHNPKDGNATVASWQAEHFGREVRAVYMMAPDDKMRKAARFPEQVDMFPTLLHVTTPSETQHYKDFHHLSSEFNRWNASLNHGVQNIINTLPSLVGTVLKASSGLGNGVLFFILIPFAMATGGVKRASQVLFATVAVTLVVGFAKLHFAVPRPFYLYPDLQLADASGFAFPSGHTATAFAVWGLVYFWLKQAGRNSLAIWLVPSLLVALSRVYLGVHYVTDVAAGAVVGTLIAAAAQSFTQKEWIATPRLWLGIGAIALPLAATQIQPTFLYCLAFSLVFASVLLLMERHAPWVSQPLGKRGFVLSLVGVTGIAAAVGVATQLSNSSIHILAITTVGFALLAILIAWLVPKFSQ